MPFRITYNKVFFLLIFLLIGISACVKDDKPDSPGPQPSESDVCNVVSGVGTPYQLDVPYFFSNPELPQNNPLTVEGIALGRELFWDMRLSRNNSVSCGSCHAPESAFSDNVPKSIGTHGDLSIRNSMPLMNMAWNTSFFWDGRALTLEDQIIQPIHNPIEMDMDWPTAVDRVGTDSLYQNMFAAAFGTPCVDSVRITFAIAQFVRTMVSSNSKFDRAYRYGSAQLTTAEYRGLELFKGEGGDPSNGFGGQNGGDCFHCHGGGLIQFTDQQFHNNGLDTVFTDPGREDVTGSPYDRGLFKTPSLRNVELSAPYMHDGRFANLRDVVEHYNTGGHASATIDPLMKFQGVGLGLSEQDIDDLVSFLKTLTDTSFVNNPKFQDP